MMDKKTVSAALAIPFASLIAISVYALDSRYITHETFKKYDQQQYVRTIGDRIDELTIKESLGLATKYDKAILQQFKEKLKRIK